MDLKQFTLLIGVASLPSLATAATVYRTISKVAAVAVDCPEGTAPRLPNLVWVTYSDVIQSIARYAGLTLRLLMSRLRLMRRSILPEANMRLVVL